MCVNKKRIFNRWTNSWQWVDCGKCPSCQQAKAFKRVKRIKNATYNGYVPLFVTLTYCNLCVPYVKVEDLLNNDNGLTNIKIYRDFDVRRVRVSADYKMQYHRFRRSTPLAEVNVFENNMFLSDSDIKALPRLNGRPKYVGVCYFKDLQDFQKRLAINLQRRYGIQDSVYYFQVSEYGPYSKRPHFHLLIYVPASHLDECVQAISEAWPYDYEGATYGQKVQLARNAACYVSSYINRGSDFPDFLSVSAFRPKCSFCSGFGTTSDVLSLSSIIAAQQRGDLRFLGQRSVNGRCEDALVCYPKYALSRFFPYFKGRGRLPVDTLRLYLECPSRILQKEYEDHVMLTFMAYDGLHNSFYDGYMNSYVIKDLFTLYRTIENAYQRFIAEFPIIERDMNGVWHSYGIGLPDNLYSRELFAQYYTDVYRCYMSTLYKCQFENCSTIDEVLECYYNLDEVQGRLISDVQEKIDSLYTTDPNKFTSVIRGSMRLSDTYSRLYKRRHVTNSCMVNSGIHV